MIGQVRANRFFFIAGVTAGRSEGLSANRGFSAIENDAAVLGEVYINPNARGHAQGRVFTERGYTIKTAASYQFPHETTFGLIGRYQDGQHFARLVLMPGLNQGIEAVRAFRNGRTRFTFSMTVDARLQKGFALGGHRLTAIARRVQPLQPGARSRGVLGHRRHVATDLRRPAAESHSARDQNPVLKRVDVQATRAKWDAGVSKRHIDARVLTVRLVASALYFQSHTVDRLR